MLPAGLAALGPQVDDPIGGAHHIEIVLDDEQRMAGVDQPPEGAQQLGDIVEMQAGGRFVEQEQRAACAAPSPRRARLLGRLRRTAFSARCPASLRRCASPPDSVGHRLAQAQIVESDIGERRQAQAHLRVGGEKRQRFGDRQIEHVGDALRRRSRRATTCTSSTSAR